MISPAQEAFDRVAAMAMGGVSEWTTDSRKDYAAMDRDLRLVAAQAGLAYETDDAYKVGCEECGYPLPLNEPDDPSMHAEWCERSEA